MNGHRTKIAREIKAGLILAGIKQTEIARQTGYHPVHVNDVIHSRRPTPRIRAAIAEAIGKPVSDIWPAVAKPERENESQVTRELKAALALAGIQQVDIARTAGLTLTEVCAVVQGRRATPRIRAAIAEAIGKSVSEIWPARKSEDQEAA